MAPPAKADKAPVAKKAAVAKKVPAADGTKKKKKSKSVETYKIYLYKVLKQVRSEISSRRTARAGFSDACVVWSVASQCGVFESRGAVSRGRAGWITSVEQHDITCVEVFYPQVQNVGAHVACQVVDTLPHTRLCSACSMVCNRLEAVSEIQWPRC